MRHFDVGENGSLLSTYRGRKTVERAVDDSPEHSDEEDDEASRDRPGSTGAVDATNNEAKTSRRKQQVSYTEHSSSDDQERSLGHIRRTHFGKPDQPSGSRRSSSKPAGRKTMPPSTRNAARFGQSATSRETRQVTTDDITAHSDFDDSPSESKQDMKPGRDDERSRPGQPRKPVTMTYKGRSKPGSQKSDQPRKRLLPVASLLLFSH